MSYCVNCGVELESSEKECPLCHVPVVNPAAPVVREERPYPEKVETILKHVDRRYFAALAGLLLLVPILVCVVNDVFLNAAITWSVYVISSLNIVFVAFILPLFFKRKIPILFWAFDVFAVSGLLLLIDFRTGTGITWFWNLGLPLTLSLGVLAGLLTAWFTYKKPRPFLVSLSMISFACGLYTMCVEMILNHYHGISLLPSWSWYSLIPCVLVSVMFLVLQSRRKWRETVRKRLFF